MSTTPMSTTPLNGMESLMYSLNLRQPISRFVGVFVITNGIIWTLKPGYFFDTVTFNPREDSIVPWWALGLVTGGLAAFFL